MIFLQHKTATGVEHKLKKGGGEDLRGSGNNGLFFSTQANWNNKVLFGNCTFFLVKKGNCKTKTPSKNKNETLLLYSFPLKKI